MRTTDEIMALVTNRAPVTRTGQTNAVRAGDDGEWQNGVSWPVPRFSVLGDTNAPDDALTNCVRDNLTGLIWARNANLAAGWSSSAGSSTWAQAFDVVTNSAGPVNGSTYGGYDDWRLPNVQELWSLHDFGNPPLPSGHPFVNVQTHYWTSSSCAENTLNTAWMLVGSYGGLLPANKTTGYWGTFPWVWPVRGGGK